MALYTRSGDEGFSRLRDGGPVRKDDPRFAALGAVDELNVWVGLSLAEARRVKGDPIVEALSAVQQELFSVGAMLAAAGAGGASGAQLDPAAVARMEEQIDRICAELPELGHFILPGGCELAGRLHAARAVAHRAERALVAAVNPTGPGQPSLILRYVNRLSDLLFALGRLANHDAGVGEVIWKP